MVTSTDEKHSLTDLIDGEGTEGTDTGTDGEATKTEPSDLLNDLTPKSKESEIVENLTRKVESGEVTLEDVKSKQPWAANLVKQNLESKMKPQVPLIDKEELAKMAREEARRMIEEEREIESLKGVTERFETIKGKIKAVGASREQLIKLDTEFRKLEGYGVPPDEALKTAAQTARIDFEENVGARVNSAFAPRTGYAKSRSGELNIMSADPNKVSPEARRDWVAKHAGRR